MQLPPTGISSAIDALTGDERWRYATFGDISNSPVVADGVLYVTSSDLAMYAIAAETGAELWHFSPRRGERRPGRRGPGQ